MGPENLSRGLRISSVVAQLLAHRGVHDSTQAAAFLDCPLNQLHAPATLPGVAAAADEITRAVTDGERICIYGDYDVDGTTGTAVLLGLLRLAGAPADFYIPDRRAEGYGLNADAVRTLAAEGVKLFVTVDCGATALSEAELVRQLGAKLIVTDHHEFKDSLPDVAALVHPKLPGASYPNPHLSGAGVAFKLAWAVAQRLSGREKVASKFARYLHDALALVAMGLVADVVPLIGENRVMVHHGLSRIAESPVAGVQALVATAGLTGRAITAADIGYKLGPRINAAGRLAHARQVVELFTTTNLIRAHELAERLEELNSSRQTVERQVTREAMEQVEADHAADGAAIIVAAPGWNPGVIGVVASRLANTFGKPALVVSLDAGDAMQIGAGSGRSVAGFPLHQALAACQEHLESHGGHAAAAGFRVRPEKLPEFRRAFLQVAEQHFPRGVPSPELVADTEVPLNAITFGLVQDLDRLEPFGCGNERPVFLATNLTPEAARLIGKDQSHLDFRARQGSTTIRAVGWGQGEQVEALTTGEPICVMFTPRLNEWNGNRKIEIEVLDLRLGSDPRLGE